MAGFGPDTTAIFEEGNIANVVAAILDAPMTPDGGREGGGAEPGLADIEGLFLGRVPQAGFGFLMPGEAGDASGAGDQVIPLGIEMAGHLEDLDQTVLLPSLAAAVDGFDPICWRLAGGEGLYRFEQQRLIGFHLGKQDIAGLRGSLKCFFDSASRLP